MFGFQISRTVVIVLLLLPAFAMWFQQTKPAESYCCTVVGVTDGDTLSCLQDGQRRIIRLSGIDAPEKRQPYGLQAGRYLAARTLHREVTVRAYGQDRYGRTLAEVVLDGEPLNLSMVRAGYAWVYRSDQQDAALLQAEAAARAARIGLWADAHPVNPADFRRHRF